MQIDLAQRLYDSGLMLAEVADKLKTDRRTIRKYLVRIRSRRESGAIKWIRKQNRTRDWSEIQKYYDEKHTYSDLTAKFGVRFWDISRASAAGLFKTRTCNESRKLIAKTRYYKPLTQEYKDRIRHIQRTKVMNGTFVPPVCFGNIKFYDVLDSNGNKTVLHGSWERIASEYFSSEAIHWEKCKKSFSYEFEGNLHQYFPDFYLKDFDVYAEVKGYKTPKDEAKWNQFPFKLVIIDRSSIFKLKDSFNDLLRGGRVTQEVS